MNPYETPKIVPTEKNSFPGEYSPPAIVILSVLGFAITLSLGIVKMVYIAFQRETFRTDHLGPTIGFCVSISILIGIIYFLLRGLYRGSKISFWIIIALATLIVVGYRGTLGQYTRYHTQWEKGLFIFQTIIQLPSAAVLLTPQSWRWFHKKTSQAEQIAATDRHQHP